jgi:MFS family permease
MVAEFNGMVLFSWLIALPALAGAASTLLFGKLSDVYGRRAIILLSIAIFTLGCHLCRVHPCVSGYCATFMTIGTSDPALVFAVVGDLFRLTAPNGQDCKHQPASPPLVRFLVEWL